MSRPGVRLTQSLFSDREIIDYACDTYSDKMADAVEALLADPQKRESHFGRFVRRSLMREMHWKATNV